MELSYSLRKIYTNYKLTETGRLLHGCFVARERRPCGNRAILEKYVYRIRAYDF